MFPDDCLDAEQDFKYYVLAIQPKNRNTRVSEHV